MTEHEQLVALCENLGAARSQAEIMAAQLMRRADQLVQERGISRAEAMKGLLDVVVKGRAGEVPVRFTQKPPSP